MRKTTPIRGILALLVAALVLTLQATAAATVPAPQPTASDTVRRLVSAVNGHRLTATSRLFSSSATIRVASRTWHGRPAIERWLRAQFVHRIHLSLRTKVQVKGGAAQAVILRTTQGGDCPKGCLERAGWGFSGSLLQEMTLSSLQLPAPPSPVPLPPATLPPPPSAPPPPNVTPTIPT